MNNFSNTDQAQAFIDSADSRQTDVAIMQAIVADSKTIEDAEYIWENGLINYDELSKLTFVDRATSNYKTDPADLQWGQSTLAEAAESV